MKVGRSIISIINKTHTHNTKSNTGISTVNSELESLSESIIEITEKADKKIAKVDEIVSYQADQVYTSETIKRGSPLNSAAQTGDIIKKEVEKEVEKPKTKSSLLRKLLSKKSPSA